MSKNYVKIWEIHNKQQLPVGYEIHHIDGNHENNDPLNLKAVTIDEHLDIHLSQQDYGAVKAILIRMVLTEEQKELLKLSSSLFQKQLWDENRHNFQKMSKTERSNLSKIIGNKTKELKIGIHKINSDPILAKENSRRAGLRSAELSAGFLDTKSNNHGSKYVKDTKWWTNSEGEHKRSTECPGDGWKQGMKP